MKIECGIQKPSNIIEKWPGQYNIFSWMEYVTAIPQPLFLVTTYKENGMPNACFQAWSTYTGEGNNYFVVFSILKSHHTYHNILRNKEFCINFPEAKYLDNCYMTIKNNDDDVDEITASGFTLEQAKIVNAPRIKECFLNFECTFEWEKPLFDGSQWTLICGRVKHLAFEIDKADQNKEGRYGKTGYIYNIHAPTNPVDGTDFKP